MKYLLVVFSIAACAETAPAETAPSGDTIDVEVDVGIDVEGEDQVDAAPDTTLTCGQCEAQARTCDEGRVLTCQEVVIPGTSPCLTWVVAQTCNRFEQCVDPQVGCVEAAIEPASFELSVVGAGEGTLVHDLLWDGERGLVVFQTLHNNEPVLGLARFDREGPLGPPRMLEFVGREPRLTAADGEVYLYWRDAASRTFVATVDLSSLLLSETLDVTRHDLGQALHTMPLDDGFGFVQQDTVTSYFGRFFEGGEVVWYDVEARFDWYRPTALAISSNGADLVVWIDQHTDTLSAGHFSEEGEPKGAIGSTPVAGPFVMPALVGLVPTVAAEPGSALVLWSAVTADDRFELFVGHVGQDHLITQVRATGRADTDFGMMAKLVGTDDEGFWVSFVPGDRPSVLALARLDREGQLVSDRILNTVGGGAAVVVGPEVVNCWGVAYEGLRCVIEPATRP